MSAIIVLAPVMLSTGRGLPLAQWERCAIGLSTDLAIKLGEKDVNRYVSMTFDDLEPTSKGSKKKVFRVFEMTGAECRELAATADKTNRQRPYVDENKVAGTSYTAPQPADGDDGPGW